MLPKPGASAVSSNLAGALIFAPASSYRGRVSPLIGKSEKTKVGKGLTLCQALYITRLFAIEKTYGTVDMADHASAKKRIRQTERRSTTNRNRLSRVRTFIKKVELAIDAGDADGAKEALKVAQPVIMRGAQLGVLHRNMASRKVSRLAAQVKAL